MATVESKQTVFQKLHQSPSKIIGGMNLSIKQSALIDCSGDLTIEDNVIISEGVKIYTHTHSFEKSNWREIPVTTTSLILAKDCFIGANVVILGGIKRIGVSSVIGAGSIVTKEIPDFEIWVGNPAKKIGDVEHVIKKQ